MIYDLVSFVKLNKKFTFFSFLVCAFWYLSLLPGRLGYDYALAIKMIRQGKSTDWWTAEYFWFLKFTTFYGKSIFLSSLIGLTTLALSITFLIFGLPKKIAIKKRLVFITFLSPIFGAFGMTISHDVFQAAGIILLIGLEIRYLQKLVVKKDTLILISIISYLCLLTTKTGLIFAAINIILLIARRKLGLAAILTIVIILIPSLSSFGIEKNFYKNAKFEMLLADLKCIAQHPEARINDNDWNFLLQIAQYKDWANPKPCSNIQVIYEVPIDYSNLKLDLSFMKHYVNIVSNNPAIFVAAHIQRSRGALPPPFFLGPENQVDFDITKPLGHDTNIALQNGPELLHPSVDDASVQINFLPSSAIEPLAQFLILIINQASWFWGWGGFWFWPILLFWLNTFRNSTALGAIMSLYPLFVLHISLVILNPGAMGRYYMPTILIGIIATSSIFIDFSEKLKNISTGAR